MENWDTREQLCLIDGVLRNGDANWFPVIQCLKQFTELNRPADSYSQANCTLQYQNLVKKERLLEGKTVAVPSTATQIGGSTDDILHARLAQDRAKELRATIAEAKKSYYSYKQLLASLKSGLLDDKLAPYLKLIDNEESLRDHENEVQAGSVDQILESQTVLEPEINVTANDEAVPDKELPIVTEKEVDHTVTDVKDVIQEDTVETKIVPSSSLLSNLLQGSASKPISASKVQETATFVQGVEHIDQVEVVEEVSTSLTPKEEEVDEIQSVDGQPEPESAVDEKQTVTNPVYEFAPEEPEKDIGQPIEVEVANSQGGEVWTKQEPLEPVSDSGLELAASLPGQEDLRSAVEDIKASVEQDNVLRLSPIPQILNTSSSLEEADEANLPTVQDVAETVLEQPVTGNVDILVLVEEQSGKNIATAVSDDEDDIPIGALRNRLQPKAEEALLPSVELPSVESVRERPEVLSSSPVGTAPVCVKEEVEDIQKPPLQTESVLIESNLEIARFKKSATCFLKEMSTLNNASLFTKPLSQELSSGIKRAVDFGVIRKNIENRVIQSHTELVRDVLLMFSNAFLAYDSQSQVYQETQELYKQTLELIKETFPGIISNETEVSQVTEVSKRSVVLKEALPQSTKYKKGKRQNSPLNEDTFGKRKKGTPGLHES